MHAGAMQTEITVYGLVESFPAEQQEVFRRCALARGIAVQVLIREWILEKVEAVVSSVPPDPSESVPVINKAA